MVYLWGLNFEACSKLNKTSVICCYNSKCVPWYVDNYVRILYRNDENIQFIYTCLFQLDNASMPYVKTKHNELMNFVREQQHYYQHYSDRFWIQSLDIPPRECAVLVNRKVVKHSCNEYFPFLCERGTFHFYFYLMYKYFSR